MKLKLFLTLLALVAIVASALLTKRFISTAEYDPSRPECRGPVIAKDCAQFRE